MASITGIKLSSADIDKVEQSIGYRFINKELLVNSLLCRSFTNGALDMSNKKLAFLGDQALSLVVTNWLFENFPEEEEGQLTIFRSNIISTKSCVEYAKELQLDIYYMFNGGELSDRRLATLFEGVIGAIFTEVSFSGLDKFLLDKFSKLFRKNTYNHRHHSKTRLQEKFPDPVYTVTESGPPHQKQYQATVEVSNGMTATGELEKTKKEAEISAAQKLLDKFMPASGVASGSKERYDSQITQTEERLEKLLLGKPSHSDEQQEQSSHQNEQRTGNRTNWCSNKSNKKVGPFSPYFRRNQSLNNQGPRYQPPNRKQGQLQQNSGGFPSQNHPSHFFSGIDSCQIPTQPVQHSLNPSELQLSDTEIISSLLNFLRAQNDFVDMRYIIQTCNNPSITRQRVEKLIYEEVKKNTIVMETPHKIVPRFAVPKRAQK